MKRKENQPFEKAEIMNPHGVIVIHEKSHVQFEWQYITKGRCVLDITSRQI